MSSWSHPLSGFVTLSRASGLDMHKNCTAPSIFLLDPLDALLSSPTRTSNTSYAYTSMELPVPRYSKSQPPATTSSSPASSTSSSDLEHEISKNLKDFDYAIKITSLGRRKCYPHRLSLSPPQQSPPDHSSDNDTTSCANFKQPQPYDGLLMRESNLPRDEEWHCRRKVAQRRFKKSVFGPHDIDWRSLPTVEEIEAPWFRESKKLGLPRQARCIASQHYLRSIIATHTKAHSREIMPPQMSDNWHWPPLPHENLDATVYVDAAQYWSNLESNGLNETAAKGDEIGEEEVFDMIG